MNRLSLVSLLISLTPICAKSALLNLPQTPVFIGNSVTPNVFFQLDDSGSMDWELLIKPMWEGCAYDPNTTGSHSSATLCGTLWSGDPGLNIYTTGNGYLGFNYIFNNADNIYNIYNPTGCGSPFEINAIQACPGTYPDWRIYASSLNQIYYNSANNYAPWLYQCAGGTACSNANFSNARSYPVQGATGYNLTRNLSGSRYEIWIDDHGFTGARPIRGSALNVNNTPNGIGDLWDSHVSILLNTNNVQVFSTSYAPNASGLNANQTLQATLSNVSACYNVLGPSSLIQSIFNGTLSYNSTGAPGCMSIAQAKQNYANWYQYSRRRSMAAKGAVAYVINQYPNFNYGFNTINDAYFIPVPPAGTTNYTTYNNNILSQLFNFQWMPQGTPLRSALARVGQYYAGKKSGYPNPITQSCQQNYTILITDGYWNNPDAGIPSLINDNDGDGIAKTLADVARYYYITDLSPLVNNIIPSSFDSATWQHMVTFTMGFGLNGNLVAGSDGGPNPPLQVNSNWGNPFTIQSAKADDLWHAAFNSAGKFFGAQNPTTAGNALASVLNNIAQRSASAAPVAQNATVLNSGSVVYQGTYNSTDWSGDVLAYPINTTGVVATTANWSANCLLTGGQCANPSANGNAISPNARVLITRNWDGSNTGIPFRWPNNYTSYKVSGILPANLGNFLSLAPYSANTSNAIQMTANQSYGQALLDFLRGDRTQENQNGGSYHFRDRAAVLGDVIDSGPLFVGAPLRAYPDALEPTPYSIFKSANANRTPMIYVGANDGMVHGFNATTGVELIGYIPGATQIYQNLPNLSSSAYTHNFFADATPVEGDVYYNGAWHTILVSTLGNGGQSLSILDITQPSNFVEANASSIYLSEFSDLNDPDLGFIVGTPIIAKVKTAVNQSKWAIIFNNGYNNTQSDGHASTNGKAALYVLFLENGLNSGWVQNSSYFKIPVGTGSIATPNGLSPPFAIDINNDYITDYVYAGDLKGNLWKFDLTQIPSNWGSGASLLFSASFASAGDQPITAPPVVGPHPTGLQNGVMVYFGTGKYLEPSDNSTMNQTTQSFYGIWDKLGAYTTVNKSTLIQQQILDELQVGSGANQIAYRSLSDNPINWNATPTPQNLGWYINLIENGASNNGERQISAPILRNSNVVFMTLIPSANPCQLGGTSWLMEVNSVNGGTPLASPFDVNADGVFTSADYLTLPNGGLAPAAGIQSSVGTSGTPTIFLSPDKTTETKVLSGTQGIGTILENPGEKPNGRQNWRQPY